MMMVNDPRVHVRGPLQTLEPAAQLTPGTVAVIPRRSPHQIKYAVNHTFLLPTRTNMRMKQLRSLTSQSSFSTERFIIPVIISALRSSTATLGDGTLGGTTALGGESFC